MNYVEFAAIVLGLKSKKIEGNNCVFAKIKKDDIFFIFIISTLKITFVTNIQ